MTIMALAESTTSKSEDFLANTTAPDGDDGHMPPQPIYVQAIIIFMYSLIVVVAVGGNSLVCAIVLANKRMRTVTNFFIAALACSDTLMALLCIPFTMVSNLIVMYWPFGETMCPVVNFMQVCTVVMSALTLVGISFDRFSAILYPLRPRTTKGQCAAFIAMIWALAAGVSVPTAVTSNVSYNGSFGLCLEEWGEDGQLYAYTLAIIILQYFLPLTVLIFTYGKIGYVIWIKKPPGEAEKIRDQRMAESKRKMIKMMIVVVLTYAFCWLPYHAITLAGNGDPSIYGLPYMNIMWVCAHWLAMSNCCLNPIIYFSLNSKFRTGLKHLLRCLPCIHTEVKGYDCVVVRRSGTYTTSLRSSPPNGCVRVGL